MAIGSEARPKKRDCYEILGVDTTASQEDIRKAFRREASKHHPDRHQGDAVAEQRFKEANMAYQVLSDDKQRAIYDQFGWQGLEPGHGPDGYDFAGVDEVFSTMQQVFTDAFSDAFGSKVPPGSHKAPFQGGGGYRSARRGQDLRIEYALTLWESIFGCSKDIAVRSAIACSECDGSGAGRGTRPEVCRGCDGKGQTGQTRGFVLFAQPCPQCGGSGRHVAYPCPLCHGRGATETDRQVAVAFPPGVAHGQQVRAHGYGLPGTAGGVPGDLVVVVSVLADPRFERVGDDLVVEAHILFTDAMLGGDIKVPVLDPSGDETTMTVQIPAGTQQGTSIHLHGHGVQRWHRGGRGALIVTIHVDLPAHISDRARALVTELNAELLSAVPAAPLRHAAPPTVGAQTPPTSAAQADAARFLNNMPLRSNS